MKTDYAELRATLERLNDPEARFELGEASRNAALAALADKYLLTLLDTCERLEAVLVPRVVHEHATADDPHGVFGAPGMMGG